MPLRLELNTEGATIALQVQPYVSVLGRLFDGAISLVTGLVANSSAAADSNTAVINAAIARVAARKGTVLVPAGRYHLRAVAGDDVALTLLSGVTLAGAGIGATVLYLTDGGEAHVINMSGVTDVGIRDLTIDGNRLNNTLGVHGIRSAGHDGLRIENVYVRSTVNYGIGLQLGTQVGTYINNVYIEDTGDDGIDVKNSSNNNDALIVSNVWIRAHGQSAIETRQAGIDVRGPAKLSNIFVTDVPALSTGIRFRNGEAGDPDTYPHGIGGHTSTLSNFEVKCLSTNTTIGVDVVAREVQVVGGHVTGAFYGLQSQAQYTSATGVFTHDCIEGFVLGNSGEPGLTADDASLTNCHALRSSIIANTIGFDVGLSGAVARAKLVGCSATGNAKGANITATATDTTLHANSFVGNTVAVSDSGTATHARSNVGWVTEAYVESTSQAMDSTGTRIPSISHGLSVTPSPKHCTVTLIRETAVTDVVIGYQWIELVNATVVEPRVRVTGASSTPGATFRIAVHINARP